LDNPSDNVSTMIMLEFNQKMTEKSNFRTCFEKQAKVSKS